MPDVNMSIKQPLSPHFFLCVCVCLSLLNTALTKWHHLNTVTFWVVLFVGGSTEEIGYLATEFWL
jgi:hypothetical protein